MEEGVNIGKKLEEGKDIMLMANHGERLIKRTSDFGYLISEEHRCRNSGDCP